MLSVLWLALGSLLRMFRNRRDLVFENVVLRQQLTMLKRRRPRPALNLFNKLFWVVISRLWSQWKQLIIVVTPETVARWHRAGFRMYWRLISRVRGPVGRIPTPKELRELIFRIVAENHLGSATHPHHYAGARIRCDQHHRPGSLLRPAVAHISHAFQCSTLPPKPVNHPSEPIRRHLRCPHEREKPHKHRLDFVILQATKLIVVAVCFLTHVRLPRSYV